MKKYLLLISLAVFAIILVWVGHVQIQKHRGSQGNAAPTHDAVEQANKLLDLAEQYSREQRFDKAAEAHNQALNIGGKEVVRKYLRDQHARVINTIDGSWDYIDKGNELWKLEHYEEAAESYKRAYDIGGEHAVSGLHLAETYEKLNRYDDGIALLDEMIAKGYLSANGIKNANEMKARLVAAKNQP